MLHISHEFIVEYRCKVTKYLLSINDTRILNLVYEYISTGRGNVGRPRRKTDP